MRLGIATYGMMEFHKKLRAYMNRQRISQEVMGEAVGVSQNQVSRWQRGVNTPDIRQSLAIADFLKISLDALVDDQIDLFSDEELESLRMVNATLRLIGPVEAYRRLAVGATSQKSVIEPVVVRPGERPSLQQKKGAG